MVARFTTDYTMDVWFVDNEYPGYSYNLKLKDV